MERTLVQLLRSMQTPGLDHVVVTQRSLGALASQLPSHVPCIALGAWKSARTVGFRLARVLRPLGPCVLHARNPGTWGDALLAHVGCRAVRLVFGFHGLESSGRFSMRDRLVAACAQRFAADFTTVSAAAAEKLARELAIALDRITVLRNGVDLGRFAPPARDVRAAVRAELGIHDRSMVIGTVGHLFAVKRHDLLISALTTLGEIGTNVRLLIVGEGPERGRLESLDRLLHRSAKVIFAGARQDVPRLLAAMDVFVNCSDSEGMSNALLEAMATGLPVVATRVGGNEELVRDRADGWLIPKDSVSAIAAALREAMDPDFRERLGAFARARAEQFSFESTVHAYEGFYADQLFRTGCARTLAKQPLLTKQWRRMQT